MHAVLDLLRCPTCGAPLEGGTGRLGCARGHEVPVLSGAIPDLTGEVRQTDTAGQWFMRFEPLVQVYERVWRPAFTALAGGTDPDRETAELLEWLGLPAGATVLDVACGPGNTTRRLAEGLDEGRVVGVDLSLPMLEQAVSSGEPADGATVAYVRADVHQLPVADACVDGAHCAAALYLVSDPDTVVADVARTLRPGGRFVGMTLAPWPERPALPLTRLVLSTLSGVRAVGPDELARLCGAAGLVDFRCERRGAAVLFSSQRPA